MNGTSTSVDNQAQTWVQPWMQRWIQRGTSRLAQLLLLAVTVLVYSVLGMAIANSLFISYVGAEHLPQAFMLIGLCSVPAYVLFSQIVDRYSRPKLFRYILLISVFAVLGLRLLLTQESPYVYYLLLIAIFFQWDFHNNVLYPSLLTDYWTTLEYKRYVPYVGVAQAVGTLIGGGVTTLLSHYLRTRDLLYCLPVVFLIGVAQLIYLDRSQRRLNSVGKTETPEVGIIESLWTFPELVQRYPLALFLAGSSFLLVIIYISSEFLWFNIYGQNFSDQELTGFLGLMRILISVIQMGVVYGITRPLLKNLGVAQMNAVYPVTTLISLGGLLSNLGLPAAIGLHINGDALYKSINLPVHQLNYNAIPRESVARIRALSDGLIYAVGLTLAGAILWFSESRLSLTQIAWGVAGLAGVFLLVRLPMGRFYASGLEGMIRSNSIDLDDFEIYPVPLPLQSAEAVRELLQDEDRYVQRKGLELASLMEQPSQFLTEIEALVPGATTSPIYDQAIALFSAKLDPELEAHFQQRLQDPILQAFALEVLLSHQSPFESDQIATWQASSEAEISTLANLAQLITEPSATLPWPAELSRSCARIIIRIATQSDNSAIQALIPNLLLKQESPEILRTSLEALQSMVQTGEGEIVAIALQASQDIAQTQLNHADPMVRIAAFDLLGITLDPDQLYFMGEGLRDADQRVRHSAAKALAAYGRPGLDVAEAYLNDPQADAANAAIKAIGLVRTRYASNLLFNALASDYKQFTQTRRWQQQIPAEDPNWESLGVAIADYHDRLIQKVLYVLSALGHSRTVNSVNQLLNSNDQAALENAIEVLASLNHRRFVMPLMPLLEARVSGGESPLPDSSDRDGGSSLLSSPAAGTTTSPATSPQWLRNKGYRILLEALESKDRWIKTGALMALTGIPSALVDDPDPLVKQVASQIFGEFTAAAVPGNGIMNRLLLLKRVALFKNLSMDELLLIDQGLAQTQVSEGEQIFAEGDWGVHLYIIASGQVQLVKAVDGAQRELKQLKEGQYFGEVALFDDAPRWDGAIALSDCTLLKLEKGRFLSLVTQRPHIILEMCRFLSQRLRETDKYRVRDGGEARVLSPGPSPGGAE